MPKQYSRSPAALLSAVTQEMASVGVILGAHGGALGAQGCAFVHRRSERPAEAPRHDAGSPHILA